MNIVIYQQQNKMSNDNQPANIFAMFQRNPNCHYPCVRIDFTQIKDNYESAIKGENVFKQIIPSYNNDKLYFTDAFVLESQIGRKAHTATQSLSSEPNDESKEKFESRVQKQSENMEIQVRRFLSQEIYQAEPDSFFCQICRTPFENYREHIQHRDHVRNLEFSKGYKFVKQIVKQAKKHFTQDETDADLKPQTVKQKAKPIRSKKGVATNLKKLNKEQIKKGQKEGSSISDPIESEWRGESSSQRGEKNKEFQSIIKGQMKYSAVEQPKIQTFN